MKVTARSISKAHRRSSVKTPKAKARTTAAPKYIAPRRPVSSGGEGGSVSTYTPPYRVSSSGGEGGGVSISYEPAYRPSSYGGE
jgi:hypothetical protein